MANTKILGDMIMNVAYNNISPSLDSEALQCTIKSFIPGPNHAPDIFYAIDNGIEIQVSYPEDMYFSLIHSPDFNEFYLVYKPDSLAGENFVQKISDFETVEKHIKTWLKGLYQVVNSSALGIARKKIQEEIRQVNSRIDAMNNAPLNDAEKQKIQSALEVIRASFLEELNKRDKRLDQIEEELEQIKAKVAEGDRKGVLKSIGRFVIRNKNKFIGLAKISENLGWLESGTSEVLQLGADTVNVLNPPENQS